MLKINRIVGVSFLILVLTALGANRQITRNQGKSTIESRIVEYGPTVSKRLLPTFKKSKVSYPPAGLAFLAFKDAKKLDVYAQNNPDSVYKFIKSYSILAASGQLGPKLKEGDRQVPEGIYRAESLNPNSKFHLSIRVNYPNAFDRKMAATEGRTNLGGDIMIHGNSVSIGCLAMGDEAAEELFILVAKTGISKTKIILSPTDFRRNVGYKASAEPVWLATNYKLIKDELRNYRL